MCGADISYLVDAPVLQGSSPRVRSRLLVDDGVKVDVGIISACAEQTTSASVVRGSCWDHLRVCGADSPSRTGRRSAGDHLRVCGADKSAVPSSHSPVGSSPRVRSRLPLVGVVPYTGGIISACAEQTVVFYCGLGWSGVAEYLIHALRGVGKRRGYQYLE